MIPVLNELRVGNRVWSMGGYPDHGPKEGPKVSIPADTAGSIVNMERPYLTIDNLLYVIRWDTRQTTKHYMKQLCVIGPYETYRAFRRAVETATGKAEVVLGPQGGFREANANLILADGASVRLEYYDGQGRIWEYVKTLLVRSAVEVVETRLQARKGPRLWKTRVSR